MAHGFDNKKVKAIGAALYRWWRGSRHARQSKYLATLAVACISSPFWVPLATALLFRWLNIPSQGIEVPTWASLVVSLALIAGAVYVFVDGERRINNGGVTSENSTNIVFDNSETFESVMITIASEYGLVADMSQLSKEVLSTPIFQHNLSLINPVDDVKAATKLFPTNSLPELKVSKNVSVLKIYVQ